MVRRCQWVTFDFQNGRWRHHFGDSTLASPASLCAPNRLLEMSATGHTFGFVLCEIAWSCALLRMHFLFSLSSLSSLCMRDWTFEQGPSRQVVPCLRLLTRSNRGHFHHFYCGVQPVNGFDFPSLPLFQVASVPARYEEPQLLDLFASSPLRIAYDCAKKRFRAQFLCALARAAEAEARRNDSCVRGSWQKARAARGRAEGDKKWDDSMTLS